MLSPYRIVYPVVHEINADSYKNAIKDYVKMKNDLGLKQLIITDINNHNTKIANMTYFNNYGVPKVGINMQPYAYTMNKVDYPFTRKDDHPIVHPVPMVTPFSTGLVVRKELTEEEKIQQQLEEEEEERKRQEFMDSHTLEFSNSIATTINPQTGTPQLRIVPVATYKPKNNIF